MSDLHFGETCTAGFDFISAGTAHTFDFTFQPDEVWFFNKTKWVSTAGGDPISVWFRNLTVDGTANQQTVVDTAAAQSFNFKLAATNGFTVADTSGGPDSLHATISGITAADPCVVTHSAYTFQDNQIVRLTDLGNVGVTDRGMGQLNNNRYKITVLSATTFSLKDVITGEPIDSSAFTAYVSGGRITLETTVISLNNPQVAPYSNTNPYNPNPQDFKPIVYRLTAGTDVMGDDGDVFRMKVVKYGQLTDLGDLLV